MKKEKLRVDHWRDKEATRDAVRLAIRDYLWDDSTGLPVASFEEEEVNIRADDLFRHIYRAYPKLPSPFYSSTVAWQFDQEKVYRPRHMLYPRHP